MRDAAIAKNINNARQAMVIATLLQACLSVIVSVITHSLRMFNVGIE